MRLALLAILLPSLAVAAPALPARSPQARQAAVDLAYVLGETHALRQACQGEGDQEWRTHMSRMMETEEMDPALGEAGRRRLAAAFNAGFSVRQAQFRACRPEVQAELDKTAAKGEALARRLAGTSPP
jgi:uncharacterized protein (TIGR02301 family)